MISGGCISTTSCRSSRLLGQDGMKQNTKQRAAKNTCEHDQADFDGNHNLSLGVQRAAEEKS
jgi:hypothetical protein